MSKRRSNNIVHLQLLTAEGCSDCVHAKKTIEEIKSKFPYLELEVEEIDVTSFKGFELVVEHSVLSNPGVIINGKLFSTGHLDRENFFAKILSL